jgi:hypothetical protein
MTTNVKMTVEPTLKMLCISNIPQTVDNVQHNIYISLQCNGVT